MKNQFKTFALVGVLGLASALQVSAEEVKSLQDNLQVGFSLGLPFSKWSFPDQPSSLGTASGSTRTSIGLGLSVDLPLTPVFALSTGVFYVNKGTDITITGTNSIISEEFGVSTLEFPLLLKANFALDPQSEFSFSAGPYFSVRVGKSLTADAVTSSGQTGHEEITGSNLDSSYSDISSVDLGLRFGIDYERLITSSLALKVGVVYDLGLKNIDTSPDDQYSIHTRSIIPTIGLGILL